MATGSYLSIIILNANGLNVPTKIQRLAEWIQKQGPYTCRLQTHLKTRDTYKMKMKRWKKILHTNGDEKKAGVDILKSDEIDFKIKAMKRDKGHYITIKGSIQENITIINIYVPNIGAPQYVRQMLTSMKEEINNNKIIVGHFNTPLTPMD